MERLQKILAHAGIGSRRECERLIEQGAVTINGQQVTEVGIKIDPADSAIKVHGKLLQISPAHPFHQYGMLYKPAGVLSTIKPDNKGRQTLVDLLPQKKLKGRVYPVGRLDYNSEGLVLLTDDGELAYRLTHPKYKVAKTYHVKVHGIPSPKILNILSQGVNLEDGRTAPASVKILRVTGKNAWLVFSIQEGKKRQIRRMCKKVRFHVTKLKRMKIGPLALKDVKPGEFRVLADEEIHRLKQAVKLR